MKGLVVLLWAGAVALFIGLIAWQGAREVIAALGYAGHGMIVVALFHLCPMMIDTLAWHVLLPRPTRRPFSHLLRIRWYGESVNTLLPVAQVGGDVLRGHLHARTGVAGPTAQGIVVVDLATTVYAQMAFAALGLLTLIMLEREQGELLWQLGTTLLILTALIAGFYAAQQNGLFSRLVRLLESMFLSEAHRSRSYAQALDGTIRRLYRRRGPILASIALHLLAWLAGIGEVYLAAAYLGSPVTLLEALVLESLVGVVRAAAFLIPGALGVQEGAFMVLGTMFGLAPEQALALALIRRVRELVLGLPGLLAWQLTEGARWLDRLGVRSPG